MDSQDYRVNQFICSMRDIHFGNCDVPNKLQDFLIRDKKAIEDVFVIGDSLYILPRSRQTAKYLFDIVMNGYDEVYQNEGCPLADEIEWVKMGDRYWLSLWWD